MSPLRGLIYFTGFFRYKNVVPMGLKPVKSLPRANSDLQLQASILQLLEIILHLSESLNSRQELAQIYMRNSALSEA